MFLHEMEMSQGVRAVVSHLTLHWNSYQDAVERENERWPTWEWTEQTYSFSRDIVGIFLRQRLTLHFICSGEYMVAVCEAFAR